MQGPNQFQWQGGSSASFLDWAPEQPANGALKCAGLTDNGLESLSCAEKHEFACEASADVSTTESVAAHKFMKIKSVKIKIQLQRPIGPTSLFR
jgi:hypothetical protein